MNLFTSRVCGKKLDTCINIIINIIIDKNSNTNTHQHVLFFFNTIKLIQYKYKQYPSKFSFFST